MISTYGEGPAGFELPNSIYTTSPCGKLISKCAERIREFNGNTSTHRAYSSVPLDGRTHAKTLAGYVRGHWGGEQPAPATERELSHIRKDHGPETSAGCFVSR
jgi:hypothetical protein